MSNLGQDSMMSWERSLKSEAIIIWEELQRRKKRNKIDIYYPDKGPFRRELYPKHLEFFRLGTEHRERLFLAANRVGKTEGTGGYELTCHLTGRYPHWWEGFRFNKAINAGAVGDTSKTTRDIIQAKLFGDISHIGTGLIPGDTIIGKPVAKPGVPNAYELARILHVSGGISTLGLKSYDQGVAAFQGTEQDVILLDEEPPMDVYTECVLRTMATSWFDGGMIMCTFTPLLGMSEVVTMFLPGGKLPV